MGGSDSVTAFSSVTGMAINGVLPTSFQVSLADPSGKVFDNLNLATTPPSLKSFAMNQWRLNFGGVGNYAVGSLAHLTAVPLPAAVLLFGAGLISLVGLGAGGLRNLRRPQHRREARSLYRRLGTSHGGIKPLLMESLSGFDSDKKVEHACHHTRLRMLPYNIRLVSKYKTLYTVILL